MKATVHRDRSGIRVAVILTACLIAGLSAGAEKPLWAIAWLTDTQTPAEAWINTLVARVQADKPAVVIHTGDTRFEWANRCAWRAVMNMFHSETPPHEFHLAPGNHDLMNGVLKRHLRNAATQGLYRLDTGRKAAGFGYYHNRVPQDAAGPLWPRWNPEVIIHPAWQLTANTVPKDWRRPEIPYRYVFKRGGLRFILCDCFPTEDQVAWVRRLIVQPDDSSVSILLQHKHEADLLAPYFAGLEGQHNVKLVLTGDHHNYVYAKRHGVTFITAAGLAKGPGGENDAMTLWVYPDRLRLDRYIIPHGARQPSVQGPTTIWTAEGRFSEYQRPAFPVTAAPRSDSPASATVAARTIGPNLLSNGDFDNHIWYERYRGWSPTGWYQWFTRGGHAPEHAVGKYPSPPHHAHTGKEYVRIHMWAHAWRGGILQTVRGVEPCHHYRLTAYGFFQPEGAPEPNERIGINPCGTLASQFSVDVSKHPAPKYDEGVGDDPKTPAVEGLDIDVDTVWSPYHAYHTWGKLEVTAEARSDTIIAILYCAPKQRPADTPIYEMNWDSVSLREIPWPTPRLVQENAVLTPDERLHDLIVRVPSSLKTMQVTWGSKIPAGASQVLYRFLDSAAVTHQPKEGATPTSTDFPRASPVQYERSTRRHWITCTNLSVPEAAVAVHVVALSRVCEKGTCRTLSSNVATFKLR